MKLSDLKKKPITTKEGKKSAEGTLSVPEGGPPQRRAGASGGEEPKATKIENKNILTKEDIKSPLEDEEIKSLDHRTFNKRIDDAMEIINKLSFKQVDQAQKNLKNALVLFLKDIKSEEQTADLLCQPVYLDGADLNDSQLKELFKIAQEKISHIAATKDNLPEPFKKISVRQNLPMKEGNILPASTAPFNSFAYKPAFTKEVKEIKSLDDLFEKAEPREDDIAKMMKFGKSVKTTVEDIIPPKTVSFGPIDEIKSFTLTDFRRLSSDTREAVFRLRQKFINLKEESFLFYLQAVEAWQQSPLYKKYMERICESLNKKLRLSGLVRKEDDLTEEEIKILIQMEKDL